MLTDGRALWIAAKSPLSESLIERAKLNVGALIALLRNGQNASP
jgi:hypothetical protein